MTGRLGELIVILLIVFIFFGAGKLPKVMGELGKSIKGLRKGGRTDNTKVQQEVSEAKEEK